MAVSLAAVPLLARPAQAEWNDGENVAITLEAAMPEPDIEDEFEGPPSWVGRHWRELAVAAAGSAAIYFDGSIRTFIQGDVRSDGSDSVVGVVGWLGDPYVLTGLMGTGYAAGWLAEDERIGSTSFMALQSFVMAGGLVQGIKRTARRDRPSQSLDPYVFNGPISGSTSKSFISGHSAAAFSVATVVAHEYDDSPLVPAIAYTLATLASFSRVHDNHHWASDAILGSTLGYAVGRLVYELNTSQLPMNRMTVLPLVGPDISGLLVRFRF